MSRMSGNMESTHFSAGLRTHRPSFFYAQVNGITLAQSRQSLDMHSSITHDAPSATSRQKQRNVIGKRSRTKQTIPQPILCESWHCPCTPFPVFLKGDRGEAIFKGRIRIPKHAQLTDSDQICRTIMLGDRARIIAMPTLEITADNVVCRFVSCTTGRNIYTANMLFCGLWRDTLLSTSFITQYCWLTIVSPTALHISFDYLILVTYLLLSVTEPQSLI